jgi:hypothetical protein
MHEVERLLTAATVQITSIDSEHPDAQYCLAEYVTELNRRSQRGFDPSGGATALPHEVRPPAGEFFVAYLHGEAVGCAAVSTMLTRQQRSSPCGSLRGLADSAWAAGYLRD